MKRGLLLVLSMLAIVGCEVKTPDVVPPNGATPFGFARMRVNNVRASGDRPLLVIMSHVQWSTVPFNHDRQFYRDLYFGSGNATIQKYSQDVSYGGFRWVEAGVVGPVNLGDVPPDTSLPDVMARTILRAAEAGFNYAPYDTNHNGVVESQELGIALVDDATLIYAATRGVPCVQPPGQGVRVCVAMSAHGQQASFVTIAHELTHLLGAWDLYGSNCNSYGTTLMSCTIVPSLDDREVYHLDPWHKIQLGWSDARAVGFQGGSATVPLVLGSAATAAPVRSRDAHIVERIEVPGSAAPLSQLDMAEGGTRGGTLRMMSVQWRGGGQLAEQTPLIFFDGARGKKEYFMAEYRSGAFSGGSNFDRNVAGGAGLALWQVQVDDNLFPRIIPGLWAPHTSDAAVFLFGAPDGARGANRLWVPANGTIAVTYIDGTDSGLRLRLGNMQQDTIDMEWGVGSLPAAQIRQSRAVERNGHRYLWMAGRFGVDQRERRVRVLTNRGAMVLPVRRWNSGEVVAELPWGVDVRSVSIR